MIPQSKQDPDDARDIKVADEVIANASSPVNDIESRISALEQGLKDAKALIHSITK